MMNLCVFVGRLVYEPEMKYTNNQTAYVPLRIAIDRNDKNKNTDFIPCRAWGKVAEFVTKYFKKGDPIEIIGRLQSESYEKQDGTKVNELVVYVKEVNFVPRTSGQEQKQKPYEPEQPKEEGGLPFEV